LLVATAGLRDASRPCKRLVARRQFEQIEAAVELGRPGIAVFGFSRPAILLVARPVILSVAAQYFQQPGVAEAELERDGATTMRRITFSLSGDGAGGVAGMLPVGKGFLHNTVDPAEMPAWVNAEDLAHATVEFRRTGFRGGLNWYRSLRLSWELLAPWRDAVIQQPSLFIGGERDDVLKFPASRASIDKFSQTLPGLRGCHLLQGAGHWVQRERSAAVNELLLAFLRGL
jgi:pimeloyl-ACP methyl ester carboxylesterase